MKSEKHINAFKVPEAYFDKLEDRIMQKVSMEQLPKQTGMLVPKQYFEQLEARIIAKTNNTEKQQQKPKVIRLKTWRYVAAVACMLALGIWIQKDTNTSIELSANLYTIDNYIEEIMLDMPESSVLSLIEELDSLDETTPFGYKINKKEVEEYLMENLDLNTLLSYE